mmetsp:Transcript_35768/g.6448  ORF Transcript_35768/g.6448 Transcript_35768/m.6448 type:complete len:143 (+) Transcript_35768:3280-3708(+)
MSALIAKVDALNVKILLIIVYNVMLIYYCIKEVVLSNAQLARVYKMELIACLVIIIVIAAAGKLQTAHRVILSTFCTGKHQGIHIPVLLIVLQSLLVSGKFVKSVLLSVEIAVEPLIHVLVVPRERNCMEIIVLLSVLLGNL